MVRLRRQTDDGEQDGESRAAADRSRDAADAIGPEIDEARAPESPTDLHQRSLRAALKRAVGEFREDNLLDWAAALTYYSGWRHHPREIQRLVFVVIGAEAERCWQRFDSVGERAFAGRRRRAREGARGQLRGERAGPASRVVNGCIGSDRRFWRCGP